MGYATVPSSAPRTTVPATTAPNVNTATPVCQVYRETQAESVSRQTIVAGARRGSCYTSASSVILVHRHSTSHDEIPVGRKDYEHVRQIPRRRRAADRQTGRQTGRPRGSHGPSVNQKEHSYHFLIKTFSFYIRSIHESKVNILSI